VTSDDAKAIVEAIYTTASAIMLVVSVGLIGVMVLIAITSGRRK
jgi:hypothetical protein